MREVKMVEIRDRMTFIPAMAIKVRSDDATPADRLMLKAGFSRTQSYVILVNLLYMTSNYDPHNWTNRSMKDTHEYLQANWDLHEDGAVIDVEYINGETTTPKRAEME